MKKYWKSLEEYKEGVKDDHVHLPNKIQASEALKASRRDFLKYFGFSVASAAVLASCERPVKKAIPLLIQPEEVRPGVASFYASTFYVGSEAVPILVKVRDGRPIKIEGNELSKLTHGGTSAQVQASLLGLYDESRPKNPTFNKEEITWEKANAGIKTTLDNLSADKDIVLLTATIISPSQKALIEKFKAKYPNLKQISLDTYSYSGLREAYEALVGEAIIPSYRFDKAKVIVSFGADFLGTWLMPTVFTHQYVQNRKLDDGQKNLSKHIHFEGLMSLTGSNADERYVIKPSQEGKYVLSLYNEVAKTMGLTTLNKGGFEKEVKAVATQLLANKSASLVLSGSNDKNIQLLVGGINAMLGSYGSTIDINQEINLYQGNDRALDQVMQSCKQGEVGALICLESNPAYNMHHAGSFKEAIKNVGFSVNITSQNDETSALCNYVLPASHFLESWGDAEAVSGMLSLTQPVIRPIYNTKDINQILLNLLGEDINSYDYLYQYWQDNVIPQSPDENPFISTWKKTLSAGLLSVERDKPAKSIVNPDLSSAASKVSSNKYADGLELIAYQSVPVGDGKMANNPWLQELPDPVSRVCWDNYFSVSPRLAEEKGWKQGDVISVSGIQLPVFVQPGNHNQVISVALGYGRTMEGPKPEVIGKDVKHLFVSKDKSVIYHTAIADAKNTGRLYELATTQSHHSMEGRAIVRETSLSQYLKDPASGNEMHAEIEKLHTTLYNKHEYKGHHWAMFIDLNSCTGCNACVVACNVENNVPVVGRDEVRRSHEMHWIRIDRYYTQAPDDPASLRVVRQPVMCQHCDNAPCENVCPVAATNHSSEGINQMAYNRCIGTRYCNNNCPYKVRRFNWYDYNGADAIPYNRKDPAGMSTDLKRLVLNPDVTVRAKGVIEKCSFCIQRIQEKKLDAKKAGEPLRDGAIQTACQQGCPAKAITFGDMNDEKSAVSKMMKDPRRYHLLEELHTLPSVAYLTKVRNMEEELNSVPEHKNA
ncbi:prokaryotic molybdopterin-containing oxidoreductase family, iron-sulfur binding subunit [Saccharicrinis carchari]|uniref:Prokaryotic molybdopterin-containing oxidoreductase family, iron-sulfur binding subunit n=1 Tax=Saccharicrinis carchari TaxID=1168039 RepID=A0A521EJF6_SACCC|nr:Fe-S-cluster-containing hydrogenase [Saccharicrinis carchari]SMO84057.1 prokaryotic molybdopterin-containing oxidoreductase family, iron-sulfur binding subunit [Saccharicrinis carchari]